MSRNHTDHTWIAQSDDMFLVWDHCVRNGIRHEETFTPSPSRTPLLTAKSLGLYAVDAWSPALKREADKIRGGHGT
jgi:hypothetical protein